MKVLLAMAAATGIAAFALSTGLVAAQPDEDVPGMDYNAVSGKPCQVQETHDGPTYVFGRCANGELSACHYNPVADTDLWDGPLSGSMQSVQQNRVAVHRVGFTRHRVWAVT